MKFFNHQSKAFSVFKYFFFLLATSPDFIAQVQAHIQHKHLKNRPSYFQLVCLGMSDGIFRKYWYCWIAKGKEDVFLCNLYVLEAKINGIPFVVWQRVLKQCVFLIWKTVPIRILVYYINVAISNPNPISCFDLN